MTLPTPPTQLNTPSSLLISLSSRNLEGKSVLTDYADLAYSFMAPVIVKYVLWIDRVAEENHLDGILFSARDGWLLKRMYDEMVRRRGSGVPSFYFYTSRKLAAISGMDSEEDFLHWAKVPYAEAPEDVLRNMFHLTEERIKPYVPGTELKDYIVMHREEILKERDVQRRNYLLYMEKLGLAAGKRYAFVDFVASGTVAKFLVNEILFEILPVYACFYGELDAPKVPKAQPMLVGKGANRPYGDMFFANNYTLFETFLTSPEPSVAAMTAEGEPEFGKEMRDTEEMQYVQRMQEAVYRYFTDFLAEYEPGEEIPFAVVDWLASFLRNGEVSIDCPYLKSLRLHQDLGNAEVKAFKDEIRISVVVTTRNRRYEVRRALERVYAQTHQPHEVILVDDASTDGTKEYLEKFDFPNLVYIRCEEQQGPGKARNLGIECASGNYIAFLDSDDEWKPEKLERFAAKLAEVQDRNEEVDICFSSYKQHEELDAFLKCNRESYSHLDHIPGAELLTGSTVVASAAVYSKEILEKLGGFSEQYRTIIDWELIVRYVSECYVRAELIPEVLTECWQVHDGAREDKNLVTEEKKKVLAEYRELLEGTFQREQERVDEAMLHETQELAAQIAQLNGALVRKNSFYQLLAKWMELSLSGGSAADALLEKGVKEVAIYGAGKHGELLFKDLASDGRIKISCFIDKKLAGGTHHEHPVFGPKDALPKVDAIIVTPYLEFEAISRELKEAGNTVVLSLEDVI